jgi:insertion element IS1 protein InsB
MAMERGPSKRRCSPLRGGMSWKWMSYGPSWGARLILAPIWIWIVLCRRTRQVVAWMWGDHSSTFATWLWRAAPSDYQQCPVYSDGWRAYQGVIPQAQLHEQEKKGPTNHVERFNLTLRQRLSRLVRKTLSFSKSLLMLLVSLRRFFRSYNSHQARKYQVSLLT